MIDEYWAAFFGLSPDDFLDGRPKVVPHAGLGSYRGAWLFRHGPSFLISVPPEMVDETEHELQKTGPGTLSDEAYIALFGDRVERVIPWAYQGYLKKHAFRPVASAARLLSPSDDDALRELAAHCAPQEWAHSSIKAGHQPNFGLFISGKMVAASNCQTRAGGGGSPGLITHPHNRGRGYAKAVLSVATEFGLNNGLLMIYQTLMENTPSVAAAESLGYHRYAVHRAIRLK